MTIGMHFIKAQTAIMVGGVLVGVANVINAFSTDFRILFFSFGIVEGK